MKNFTITEEDIIELRDKIDKLHTTHEYVVEIDKFGDLNLGLIIKKGDTLSDFSSGEKIIICYFSQEEEYKLDSCGWVEHFLNELVSENVLSTFVKKGKKLIEEKKAEQIRMGEARPSIEEVASWLTDPENKKEIENMLDEMFPNLRKDDEQ